MIRQAGTIFALALLLLSAGACMSDAPPVYTWLENRSRVEALRSYLEGHPSDIGARYELIAIYLEELFFLDAEHELESLIDLRAQDVDAYNLLALVLVQGPKSDYLRAARLLEHALEIAPDRIDTRLALALTYAHLGETGKVRSQCEAILRLSTDPQEQATAFLILSAVDLDREGEYLRKAAELDPSVAASTRPISVPIYINARRLRGFGTHPEWPVRLEKLEAARSRVSRPPN